MQSDSCKLLYVAGEEAEEKTKIFTSKLKFYPRVPSIEMRK